MEYIIPDYYDTFRCIAGKCPDTCCAGWEIMIDEQSMKRYKKQKGGFGNRLHNSIDPVEHCFYQYEHRCAFLNEDNLCDMVTEAGEQMLCKTCREFPRHVEEYENLREVSLSLGCPESARLLLERQKPVQWEQIFADEPEEEYKDFDYLLFADLQQARKGIFSILQNRTYPIRTRMQTVLALGHDLQKRLREDRGYEIQTLVRKYQSEGLQRMSEKWDSHKQTAGQKPPRQQWMKELYRTLYKMETLKPAWKQMLKEQEQKLYECTPSEYAGMQAQPFDEIAEEQLMVYFIYMYFLGSVYDAHPHPYSRIKQAVVSTLLIRELTLSGAGSLTEIAWRYSKEIEHSEENMNRMELLMRGKPEYGIHRLMELIGQPDPK